VSDEERVRDVNSYYGNYWTEGGFCPHGESWPGLEQLFAKYLPRDGKILDVGCGDALTSGPLIALGTRKYVGVDLSDSAVLLARQNGFDAERIKDAGEIPFEDDQFDAAVCIEVFEHLFLPHIMAREILRVLKPNGVLIATVPNAAHWRRRLEVGFFGLFDPYGDNRSRSEPWRDPHIRFFTPASLGRMLQTCGFDKVFVGGNSTVPLKGMRGISRAYWLLHSSRFYNTIERACPSLLSFRAHAVAHKPMDGARVPSATRPPK